MAAPPTCAAMPPRTARQTRETIATRGIRRCCGNRLASVFYPIGVSLYSVALVAYPSLLAPASSPAERGRKAGWVYAVAGWFGSAMGIGMGLILAL